MDKLKSKGYCNLSNVQSDNKGMRGLISFLSCHSLQLNKLFPPKIASIFFQWTFFISHFLFHFFHFTFLLSLFFILFFHLIFYIFCFYFFLFYFPASSSVHITIWQSWNHSKRSSLKNAKTKIRGRRTQILLQWNISIYIYYFYW